MIHEGSGESNELNGGTGTDDLYGDNGIDTFVFDNTSNVDVIHYFNNDDGDILDLSDILTGFTAGVSDIDDFVQFTDSGDHSIMSVDVNGSVGGSSFTNIAEIWGHNGLDASTLELNGQIIG